MAPQGSNPASTSRNVAVIVQDGFVSGVIGGAIVAVFFLIVDAIAGHPLMTPTLLGSVFLLGKSAADVTAVQAPVVVSYTAVHMLAFIAAGIAAAWSVWEFEEHPHIGVLLLFLFLFFEVSFLGLTFAFAPDIVRSLGGWLIGIANLLSAAGMAIYLLVIRHPKAFRSLDRVFADEEPQQQR
jgi:hypothetical protein